MNEYTIIADYEIGGKVSPCLVATCGKNIETAEKVLAEMLTTDKHKALLGKGVNPRIKENKKEECWWNQGGLD